MTRARSAHTAPSLSLEQLRAFIAVADGEHVTGASEELGMTQGSVSMLIRRLEAAVGLPLFERVGRRVRLTDAGRALRPIAGRIMEEVEEIHNLRTGYEQMERGELHIAAGRVIGAHRLATWLAPFALEHASLTIRITLAPADELLALLQEGRADVVFVGAHVTARGVQSLVLERTEMVLVVSARHPLAHSHQPLSELSAYRHLQHEVRTATRPHAVAALGTRADLAPGVELEEGALHAALVAGLGFAVMPRAVVDDEITSGRLVMLPLPGRPVTQEFSAARRTGTAVAAVGALWTHLTAIAADVPPSAQTSGSALRSVARSGAR